MFITSYPKWNPHFGLNQSSKFTIQSKILVLTNLHDNDQNIILKAKFIVWHSFAGIQNSLSKHINIHIQLCETNDDWIVEIIYQ